MPLQFILYLQLAKRASYLEESWALTYWPYYKVNSFSALFSIESYPGWGLMLHLVNQQGKDTFSPGLLLNCSISQGSEKVDFESSSLLCVRGACQSISRPKKCLSQKDYLFDSFFRYESVREQVYASYN